LKVGNGPGVGSGHETPLLLRSLENYAEYLEATNGQTICFGRPIQYAGLVRSNEASPTVARIELDAVLGHTGSQSDQSSIPTTRGYCLRTHQANGSRWRCGDLWSRVGTL